MKRIVGVILFFLLAVASSPVFADVMPYYTGSLSKDTMGFLQVPRSFTLYLYPREDSQIIDNVSWNDTEVRLNKKILEPSALFAAQIQSKDLAFCMVTDEHDGWYKIIYDKSGKKEAWLKPKSDEAFWSLKDFYSYFGRQYGLYYMKNIDYHKRGLYSGADKYSQKINGFTYIRSIKLNKLSGNWVLVTVTDIDNLPKIGYIQWREEDGTIVLFPKFSH